MDPVAESAAIVADEQRNQRVNLETGEVFPIDDDLPEFDTFDTIRSADPPPDVDEQEIREKKIRTGFFAKMLHRYLPALVVVLAAPRPPPVLD